MKPYEDSNSNLVEQFIGLSFLNAWQVDISATQLDICLCVPKIFYVVVLITTTDYAWIYDKAIAKPLSLGFPKYMLVKSDVNQSWYKITEELSHNTL